MSTAVRLGLVGCGRLAEHGYVPAAALADGLRIVAVADPDPDRRATVAAAAGADGAFEALAPMLERADVDAVVLATPAAHHVADAALAVASGRPVLVEKPPAPDLDGALALAALGSDVHVGFNRRFDPGVARLRATVAAAGPLDLDLRLTYRRASWGAHTVRDEVVLDLVPHLVDWARWLSGADAATVRARLAPDRATITLGLTSGRATLTAAADRVHEEVVQVRGAGGARLASHRRGGPVAAVTGRAGAVLAAARGRTEPHPLAASLAAQLEAFAAAVRGGDPGALGTAADGVAAMAVVDAARSSAAAGGVPVPVTHPSEPPC